MDWRGFLRPDGRRLMVVVLLFIFSLFFGVFPKSWFIEYVPCSGPGCLPQRECGPEGVFNPLLRPVSFILVLILEGGVEVCPILGHYILYMPLEFVYWYLFSCLLVYGWDRFRKKK